MSQNESEQDTGHGMMSGFFWIKRKNKCPITDILSWKCENLMWNNKLRTSVLLGKK